MKRHFARILTALLLLALLPGLFLPVRAASGVCGPGAIWEYDEETATLTISGRGPMQEEFVDTAWDLYKLSFREEFVDTPWEQYQTSIRSVIIEEGVRNIGAFAFYGCTALQEVQIPSSVTVIGEYAFAQCDALKSIEIPEGVTEIQDGTFSQCDGLKTVTLPQSLETIGDGAFYGCGALETVELPKGLKKIRNEAFARCDNLKDIRIPWGTKIGRDVFEDCTQMSGYFLWRFWNALCYGFWGAFWNAFWNGFIMLAAVASSIIAVVWLVFCIRTRREERREAGESIPWLRYLLGILTVAALILGYMGLVWLLNLNR